MRGSPSCSFSAARPRSAAAALAAAAAILAAPAAAETVLVGSKRFTESYILGEILRETAARAGATAEHKPGPRQHRHRRSRRCKSGAIDVYPEYTGTIAREILRLDGNLALAEIEPAGSRRRGLGAGVPLGFNNTYALAMRDDQAAKLGIRTLSDLARHPRAEARPLAGVHRPRRRLAGPASARTACRTRRRRTRPRPRLRGDRRGAGRRDRHLLDRREDRALRAARARGRPRLLPEVRRRAPLPLRPAAALAAGLAGARRARRAASTTRR